jgi:hypothetical protein
VKNGFFLDGVDGLRCNDIRWEQCLDRIFGGNGLGVVVNERKVGGLGIFLCGWLADSNTYFLDVHMHMCACADGRDEGRRDGECLYCCCFSFRVEIVLG